MSKIRSGKDIAQATNPDQRNALTAMLRAAQEARELAIQTNTAIVIMQDGVMVRVTADELRRQQATLQPSHPPPPPSDA